MIKSRNSETDPEYITVLDLQYQNLCTRPMLMLDANALGFFKSTSYCHRLNVKLRQLNVVTLLIPDNSHED